MQNLLIVLLLLPALFFRTDIALAPGQYNPTPKPKTITLVAVGDIMLSRNVGTKIERANNPDLPFEKVADLLRGADIALGNLECPLTDSGIPVREGLVFRCLTKNFEGVVNSGFDVLSTANNHAMDQGIDDLEFTIDYLKSQNILPVGTTSSSSPPHEEGLGEVIERNGTKFGFLAYSYSAFNDGKNTTHPQIATLPLFSPPSQGGGGEGVLQSDIINLKSQGADIIIVSMHAGTEYTRNPNQMQINFAHAAIDGGADVVIGHHPHWIQEIEIYKNKPIFYSLGNFVFDQMWSQQTREGLIVKLNIKDQKLKSAELMPVIIDNYCCPRLANDEKKAKILKKIGLGTDTLNFETVSNEN